MIPVNATPLSYISSTELGPHNVNSCIVNAPLSDLVSLVKTSYSGGLK